LSALACGQLSPFAFKLVLTVLVEACRLATTGGGGLCSSLSRRRDEAHKGMTGFCFGSVRAASAIAEHFGMPCSFILTTFLSSGRFITEEDISPRLAESRGSHVEGLQVIDDSLILLCGPGKATRMFWLELGFDELAFTLTRALRLELRPIELAGGKVCDSSSS
jgi:hypothetical protein